MHLSIHLKQISFEFSNKQGPLYSVIAEAPSEDFLWVFVHCCDSSIVALILSRDPIINGVIVKLDRNCANREADRGLVKTSAT